jgi:magnesium chelatase subunit D
MVLPAAPQEQDAEQQGAPPSADSVETESSPPGEQRDPQDLHDLVLAAAIASIPRSLLARLQTPSRTPPRSGLAGRVGASRLSRLRGRPIGATRGEPRAGARLDVIETLRAAAPWQPIRKRTHAGNVPQRVYVTRDDFRVRRFKQRATTTTVFVVDASGSSAMNRLAEAKGAVELLLAECYVRRDRVALVAFRGRGAELLLPPTRSLVRAKRALAALPGGGATPLAAGIDTATSLVDGLRRAGDTPVVILLTDGRANVARDGSTDRPRAQEDARLASRQLSAAGVASLWIDTSPHPQPQAHQLAAEMGARYLPLPYADAAALARAAQVAA